MKKKSNKKENIITIQNGIIAGTFLLLGLSFSFLFSNMIINKNELVCEYESKIYEEGLEEFVSVYESLINNYYKEINIETITKGAIDGMLESLGDPYTTYMDEAETENFNLRMQGDYDGIGAYIGNDDDGNVIISQPFSDSPAEEAGLLPMDIILKIDGVSTEGMTTDIAASLIRGEKGTDVVLTILRDEKEMTISVTRGEIELHSVTHDIITKDNKKIGRILLELFSENSYEDFEIAIKDLEDKNIDSLIIDVRSNSGGYLNEVSEILSLFLNKTKVIYQLQDTKTTEKVYAYTSEKRTYPVVVLVNGYSASASEILAGAMQESYNATLVGTTTFGKGLVQTPEYLETGGMIKYSNQKWLTPDGNWIHETGITPDYEVELNDEYFDNPSDETDNQLQKAIDILK